MPPSALLRACVACALAWAAVQAGAQAALHPPALQAQAAVPAPAHAANRHGTPAAPSVSPKAATPAVPAAPVATKPAWGELSAEQQKSLQPLQANWSTMSEAHKRKWIALSRNFPKMAPADQTKLQARMTGWAALSPQQRASARLNFAETQTLAPATGDKAAQWKAYQALSPEEKRKLAEKGTKPSGAATATKPVPASKLAKVPQPHKGAPAVQSAAAAAPAAANPAEAAHQKQ